MIVKKFKLRLANHKLVNEVYNAFLKKYNLRILRLGRAYGERVKVFL